MSATILDGRQEAKKILSGVRHTVGRQRKILILATIIVGKRFDSVMYVRLKEQAAARVGIHTESIRLPSTISQQRLLAVIKKLNRRTDITGMLLQLPLPSHLETDCVIAALHSAKDVDGLRADSPFVSPFMLAILHLVKIGKPKTGAATILARDTVFSSRLAQQLMKRGFRPETKATESRIPPSTTKSNLIITLLGRGPRLKAKDVRHGTVIIDAGIRQREGKTVGDVDQTVQSVARAVSPVPGGVGPLTIAFLMKNVARLIKK